MKTSLHTNDRPGYRGVHNWVERKLGTPQLCIDCGKSTTGRYEWANISGNYSRDTADWKRLCVSCHRKLDSRGKNYYKGLCKNGHKLNNNVYIRKNGCEECKTCRSESRATYKAKV